MEHLTKQIAWQNWIADLDENCTQAVKAGLSHGIAGVVIPKPTITKNKKARQSAEAIIPQRKFTIEDKEDGDVPV